MKSYKFMSLPANKTFPEKVRESQRKLEKVRESQRKLEKGIEFLISISLQSDDVCHLYFKLRIFDLTEFIV